MKKLPLTLVRVAKLSLSTPAGTKVIIQANPASRMMYKGGLPPDGTPGIVTPISFPGGKRTSLPGPGGGLVYVQFEDAKNTFMGVSALDLVKDIAKHAKVEAGEDAALKYLSEVARGPRRTALYPSSPKGTQPLDHHTDEQVWEAGYEAASYVATSGVSYIEGTDLFLLAINKLRERRIPAKINESHPQFWEYLGTFIEGAEAYARSSKDFQIRAAKSAPVARYEEGKPADPTENMSPEDAAKWKAMNEEHGDKFKKASRYPAVVKDIEDDYRQHASTGGTANKTASAFNLWAAVTQTGNLLGATEAEAGRNERFWEKLAAGVDYQVVRLSNVPEGLAEQLIDFSGSRR